MSSSVLLRYLDAEALNRLAGRRLEPRGLVMGTLAGAHKSPLHGFAVEFSGHREYVWGDDPKHIDWRVYFTREKYFVKQYEMETNLVCHLVLDVSASMLYGEGAAQKLLYASRLAALLANAIVRQSDKVSLATFDDAVRVFLPPSSSPDQVVRMASELDSVKAVEKTRMPECLSELCGRMGRREIVLVLSDFLCDPASLEPALQRLRYSKHQVALFQVLHHDEIHFDLTGRIKFLGLESADSLTAAPESLREAYLRAFGEWSAGLADVCQRNGVELVPVETSRDLAEVLGNYLARR